MSNNNNRNQKAGFLGKLFGLIGVGASLYGLKKVVDLYVDKENEDLIGSQDYERLIRMGRENNSENLDDFLFDYDKIVGGEEADELFKRFLNVVEFTNEIPDKVFKISDIEKLIPFKNMNIANRSTYDHSIMKMLSGVGGRDYFLFKDMVGLGKVFAEECNKDDGNNILWKVKYEDERFIINPKYYLKNKE